MIKIAGVFLFWSQPKNTWVPQSNSHTFLARILQKWYISDTICKNLARILDFRQTCQSLADQTFLADWDVSCKILAGQDISCKILGRILQDNVWNLKDILQENVWNVRETTRLFSNFKPGICSNWMWMSRICSRADLNVTKNFKPSKNFERSKFIQKLYRCKQFLLLLAIQQVQPRR